jgi:hypothetical protein
MLSLVVFCCTSSEFVSAGMSFAEHENVTNSENVCGCTTTAMGLFSFAIVGDLRF